MSGTMMPTMCQIFGGDPVTQLNLKNVFVYEIGLIAIHEMSPQFDEEQQYGRPYQPKHNPSSNAAIDSQFVRAQHNYNCIDGQRVCYVN